MTRTKSANRFRFLPDNRALQRRTSSSAGILVGLAIALIAPLGSAASAQEQASISWKPKFSYPVKFVCGPSSEGFQEGVVAGFHATAINIHNPSLDSRVRLKKQIARALPFQASEPVTAFQDDVIEPNTAIEVECNEIRMRMPASMTTQFRTGFLVILSDAPLNVVSVYSSRPMAGEVSTLDVEVIDAVRLADAGEAKHADLIVSDIDIANLRVDCSSTNGCVTRVDVSIKNQGDGDAGPFETKTTFDPAQSIDVVEQSPAGLAAGASKTFTVTTPPGRNCYDPDCEICAFVDSGNAISESDESNNKLCRVRKG